MAPRRSRSPWRCPRRRSRPVVVVPPEGPGGRRRAGSAPRCRRRCPRALQRAGVPAVPDRERRRAQEALGAPAAIVTRATSDPDRRVARRVAAGRGLVGPEGRRPDALAAPARRRGSGALSAPLVGSAPLRRLGGAVHSARLGRGARRAEPPPAAAREALQKAGAASAFDALRALGEGMAARDAASQVAGCPARSRRRPAYEEAALVLARLLVDAATSRRRGRRSRSSPPARPSPATRASSTGVALLGLRPVPRRGRPLRGARRGAPTAAVLANRAIARLRAGGAAGASTLLRQAVEAEPASLELPFDLGWALLVEGEPAAAAFWLKGAVRRDPGDAQGRLLLSWALPRRQRPEEAEEQWRAAAALDAGARADARARPVAPPGARAAVGARACMLDPARSADAEASRAHEAKGEALLAAGDARVRSRELTPGGAPRPLRHAPAPAPRAGARRSRATRSRPSPSCAWPCGAATTRTCAASCRSGSLRPAAVTRQSARLRRPDEGIGSLRWRSVAWHWPARSALRRRRDCGYLVAGPRRAPTGRLPRLSCEGDSFAPTVLLLVSQAAAPVARPRPAAPRPAPARTGSPPLPRLRRYAGQPVRPPAPAGLSWDDADQLSTTVARDRAPAGSGRPAANQTMVVTERQLNS